MTVEQPSTIDITPIGFDSASCNGFADGRAYVGGVSGVSGGNGSVYTYTWTDALGADLAQDNDTAVGLASGIYDVRVEDSKGCFETGQVTVEQPSSLVLSDTILDSATCSVGGTALVRVTGGTPNYSYLWSDGSNQVTDTATNLASGTYKVIVTDNNGCKDSITNVTVPVIGGVTAVVDTVIDVLCFGAITGGVNISTDGVLPITYSWVGDNGYTSSSEDITNLAAGSYSVTITDGNNCVTVIDTVITAPENDISIVKDSKDLKCFNDGSGSIEVLSVNNGSAPYDYNWIGPNGYSSSSSSPAITSLAAGVYVLSLTDANLCTLNNDSTVILEPDTISVTYVLTQPACGASDGSILVTPSGGGGDANPPNNYSYSWADLGIGPGVIGTTSLLDNIGSGLYEVTVTDDSSCVGSESINISDINGPLVEDSTVDVTCNNDTDGKIFLTVTTQPPGNIYGIDWDIDNFIGSVPDDLDGLQDSLIETELPPGVYFVRITDSTNGCVTLHSDTVFDPGPIVLNPNFDAPSCFGLSNGKAYPENISGGNGGYNYLWSDGQLTDTAFNLGIGSYTLTVTDSKACSNTMVVDATQPDSIYITLDQDSITCFGESNGMAFLDSISGGTGDFTYSWDLFAIAQNPTNATNDTAVGLSNGTYAITVTDQNNCSTSVDIEVKEPDLLVIGSMIMDSVSCNGVSDGTASAIGITGGNGIYNFSWADALGVDLLQDNDTAIGLSSGNYTIEIKDQNNCSISEDIEVKEPNQLTIDSIYQESVKCYGFADGSAVITNVSGGTGFGYNFTWTDSLGNNLSQDSSTAINLSAGLYNITVTDSDACSTDTNVTVLQPNLLVVDTTSQISVTCNGDNDGSAYVAVSGGNGIYNYLWSDGQVTDTANNLVAGTYLLNIKEQKLCSLDTSVTVLEPSPLLVDTTSQDSVSCNGSSNGSAYVGVIGGTGTYNFTWTDSLGINLSQDSSTAINLSAGIYTIIVKDQLLCTIDTNVTVIEPDTFVVDTSNVVSPYCTSSTDAIINLDISGGTSPYSFSWSDSSTTFSSTNQNLNNLLPGIYYVVVTDNNGCTATDTVT